MTYTKMILLDIFQRFRAVRHTATRMANGDPITYNGPDHL